MMTTPQQDGRKTGYNARKRSILDIGATSAKRGRKPVRPKSGTTLNAPGAPIKDKI
jgi:hypothetical protein